MLTGCARNPENYSLTDTCMGTVCNVSVTGDKDCKDICEEVLTKGEVLEKDYLSRRLSSSEVFKINQSLGNEGEASVSPYIGDIIKRSEKIYMDSDETFDITLGKLISLWNIDELADADMKDIKIPEDNEIELAKADSGFDKIDLKDNTLCAEKGIVLDLGSVGKGLALDEAAKILKKSNDVECAVVSFGGSIYTYGKKKDNERFKVGIVDPFNTSEIFLTLSVEGDTFISTSGTYERFIEYDNKRYHHILDPKTGFPADSGLVSVTVIAKDGYLSDALSTACLVLGKDKGLELADKYGAKVLFIDKDSNIITNPAMDEHLINN
ncbi:MAG: FAD:protein FMN transferase [Lachnospiraceae bacterium]|nr:FAD:protein FMN transferase [Lachnospiraceae bacterium]